MQQESSNQETIRILEFSIVSKIFLNLVVSLETNNKTLELSRRNLFIFDINYKKMPFEKHFPPVESAHAKVFRT